MMGPNHRSFLKGQEKYFADAYAQFTAFGGPSVYLHQQCLKAAEEEFLSVRHIEMLYATLASWGMHRMGGRGQIKTKLTDWGRFYSSIKGNAEAFEWLRGRKMLETRLDDYREALLWLAPIYRSLDLTEAGATVVVNSKALHHILPELIPPIDRQYTIRFCTQPSDRWRGANGKFRMVLLPPQLDEQFQLFRETCEALKQLADEIDPALFATECQQHGVPGPKALDNAIVNYVRIVGRIPAAEEPVATEMRQTRMRKAAVGSTPAGTSRSTSMPRPLIDEVWDRLRAHEGERFATIRGLPFTYTMSGAVLRPSRTDHNISRADFAKALALLPLESPTRIRKVVRGPSYLWALLQDVRIRMEDW